MDEVAHWIRKFQVWQYSVTHSTLLLRSFHPQKYATRIDVLFSAVALMHLQPSYESLRVERAASQEMADVLPPSTPACDHGSLFLLNGGEGYVQAANFSWHEDNGDHRAPSHFGPLRGTA
ncbi:hypothetical protein IHE55_18755 [Streptomyces pactum]|uniref:Tn3 transposase DDE domain-containing protein n=1 Tax=Streptomyces pactum TaxID=68249 RepID=A0ABS0NNB8_9ACTN|nr:hypothetical protein [Streptomyces pactum]MBH5336700.1 hypothetical protein [Streptomyces pactum]